MPTMAVSIASCERSFGKLWNYDPFHASNQGWRSPLQNCSLPPYKNVLNIVWNYWRWFRTIGHS